MKIYNGIIVSIFIMNMSTFLHGMEEQKDVVRRSKSKAVRIYKHKKDRKEEVQRPGPVYGNPPGGPELLLGEISDDNLAGKAPSEQELASAELEQATQLLAQHKAILDALNRLVRSHNLGKNEQDVLRQNLITQLDQEKQGLQRRCGSCCGMCSCR